MSLETRLKAAFERVAATIKQRGMPAGGTAGQVLTKTGGADYATAWAAPASVTAHFCHIFLSGVRAFSPNAWTRVEMTNVLEDTNGLASPGRITVKADGLYEVSASLLYTNLSNGQYLNASIRVNGDERIKLGEVYASGAVQALTSGSALRLAQGDYIELWSYASGGSFYGISNSAGPGITRLTVARIG